MENTNQDLLSPLAKNQLFGAGRWAKTVGILGFIFSGFIAFVAVFMFMGGGMLKQAIQSQEGMGAVPGGGFAFVGVLYLFMAAVYFLISWWSYKFGVEVAIGLRENNYEALESASANLKNYFQAYGILFILGLAMGIFGLMVMLVAGFFAMH